MIFGLGCHLGGGEYTGRACLCKESDNKRGPGTCWFREQMQWKNTLFLNSAFEGNPCIYNVLAVLKSCRLAFFCLFVFWYKVKGEPNSRCK